MALENAVCEDPFPKPGGHPEGETQTTRQTVEVRADAEGLISHAGAYLLVELADGGDHLSDLGVLRGQEALFGAVASESTAHRAIKAIDAEALAGLRAARAAALARPGMPEPAPRS